MVKALDRKILRDLRASRLALVSIIAVVVVGVVCVIALGSAHRNLEQARRAYYERCRMADFSVEIKKAPVSAAIQRIEDMLGIRELRPRIRFPATIDLEDVVEPVSGLVISMPEQRVQPMINDIVMRSGRYFTPVRREEVIIHDPFARAHNIRPGDTIRLILNNRKQELHVVGTATSAEFTYLIAPGSIAPDPFRYGVFYVKERFAEEAFDFEGACNQIVGLLQPSHRDLPDSTLQRIEQRLDEYGVLTVTPRRDMASHRLLVDEIAGLRITATILPAIFLSVAAMVLNVMMSRIAEQQRTIVGTLKALGYGNRELFAHYVKFGLAVGLIGGLLGCAAGYVLAGYFTYVYRDFFEFPQLVNQPYPTLFALGMAVSLGFAAVGVLRGTRIVVRLQPAAAMRPKPPAHTHRTLIERWRALWLRLGFQWQMVARNIFRHRVRTATNMIAAALGAALLVLTFASYQAFQYLITFQFNKILRSDYDLILKDEHDYGALLEARRLPGVDVAEPLLYVPGDFINGHRRKKMTITGVMPGARLTVPHDSAGRAIPIPETGLLLTQTLAEQLGVQAGDTLRMQPIRGDRTPREMTVRHVAESFLGIAAYADKRYLDSLVNEADAVSAVQVRVNPAPEARRAFFQAVKELPAIESIGPRRAQREQLEELLFIQTISLGLLVGFSGILFFGSILTSSLISMSERAREIATLRVVGYGAGDIGAIFLRESMTVHLAGAVIGLPLGAVLLLGMVTAWSTEFYRVPYVISMENFLATLGCAALFVLIAHGFVARSIRRMDWKSAINVME